MNAAMPSAILGCILTPARWSCSLIYLPKLNDIPNIPIGNQPGGKEFGIF